MKRIVWLLAMITPIALYSQEQPGIEKETKKKKPASSIGIGIKAGLNFANVSNASSINSSSQTGFHAGILYGKPSKAILGSRTELLFSRQGYDYKSGSTTGAVKLDYIMLAQMLAINITKYVQVQIGAQTAILLTARADSSKQSTGNASADNILSFYNRFDYGFGGGIEIHPVKGLLIGGRYSISLANLYKQPDYSSGSSNPSSIPGSDINLKNNVVQLFIGYRF
jgi:opacity protein-like surface antigen